MLSVRVDSTRGGALCTLAFLSDVVDTGVRCTTGATLRVPSFCRVTGDGACGLGSTLIGVVGTADRGFATRSDPFRCGVLSAVPGGSVRLVGGFFTVGVVSPNLPALTVRPIDRYVRGTRHCGFDRPTPRCVPSKYHHYLPICSSSVLSLFVVSIGRLVIGHPVPTDGVHDGFKLLKAQRLYDVAVRSAAVAFLYIAAGLGIREDHHWREC